MILLVDNYDSFAHNLARSCAELGREVTVRRNDAVTLAEARALRPEAVILSPGPCTPAEAGVCVELARAACTDWDVPLLGVCLGHQAIAAALGGRVVRGEPAHGVAAAVRHDGSDLFAGLPNPLACGRYHSLVSERATLPEELAVTATLEEDGAEAGTIMAFAHRTRPVRGVQFHPESVLTPEGDALLANFLRLGAASG
ncbi:anthranilate synthase component II [Alienimonas californiensis]|uniref:Anthranilate synthase component 2 n=1 Tax=Alienimonas californiensis TaxID=2527989 RepID=A0A517PF56_9PLAN|nr:aminodeoxychorismate/anthranilate synthase component II [Alienimonas californiensis]QDT17994.1 Anthranilate synthase component 2 [Alienimonas californiensis]